MDFLPEFSTMPAPGGVRGLYRLFDEQPWRMVCNPDTRAPVIFPSAKEALGAARDLVKRKLNPDLRCQATGQAVPADDPDLLAMEEWRKTKQEEYAKARVMTRNGKNRRQVVVERKVKRGRK